MRKAQFPPKVALHKGTGQARVRWQGHDHYLGKFGSPEAEAAYVRLVGELQAGRAAPARKPLADVTVSEMVAGWLAGPGAKYAPEGDRIKRYRLAFRPLLALYGPTPAADFRADELETLRMAMATGSWENVKGGKEKEGKRKKPRAPGLCAEVANHRCGHVKCVFRWAERKGHVPEGRWAHLCALPGLAGNDASVRHGPGRKACSREELDLVLAQCLRPVRAMLLLQWHTGMRSGEVRIMRPCDIDRAGEVWVYRPAKHKNAWRGQARLVALGPECRRVLAPFLLECEGEAYLFRPAQRRGGTHYRVDTYAQAVRRSAVAAGVPDFHAYRCRHAFKQRVAREMGLEMARQAMGQLSIESTALYAAETDLKAASEVAKKMG